MSAGSNVGAMAKVEMDEMVECKQHFRHDNWAVKRTRECKNDSYMNHRNAPLMMTLFYLDGPVCHHA